jgi:hypothetical protein
LKAAPPDLSGIAKEVKKVRQHLLCCTRGLVLSGLLAERSLAPYQHAKSYRSLALSVCGIVAMCGAQWHSIENRTPMTLVELDAAHTLAQRLLHALRLRERPPVALAQALRERRQAFTLLFREYAELRRDALPVSGARGVSARAVPGRKTRAPPARRQHAAGRCQRRTSPAPPG